MDYADKQCMKTLASRADGDRPWFIQLDDWYGDLNGQDIHICDKNNKVLFSIKNGSLEQASYIISLNNAFVRGIRDESDKS